MLDGGHLSAVACELDYLEKGSLRGSCCMHEAKLTHGKVVGEGTFGPVPCALVSPASMALSD